MGYIVQSIVFDKNKGWDLTTAREWVKNHKEFSKPIKEEETTNTIRVRLFPPKKAKQMGFNDYRMKTLASGDVGIMLDIAYNKMKGGMMNEEGEPDVAGVYSVDRHGNYLIQTPYTPTGRIPYNLPRGNLTQNEDIPLVEASPQSLPYQLQSEVPATSGSNFNSLQRFLLDRNARQNLHRFDDNDLYHEISELLRNRHWFEVKAKPFTKKQEREYEELLALDHLPARNRTPQTKARILELSHKLMNGSARGGSLSSEDLEALLAKSYHSQNPSDYKDFQVDKSLSGQRVQVYHNPTTQQTIVAHRGTTSVPNWIENVAYAVGNDKSGKAFQHSKKIQDQAYQKYGKENITTIGHSKGALHAQEYGKEGKEVITLNKPVNIHDALFTRVPKSQTDIRTQYDPVSFLRPFQRGNKAETIKSTTKNPLAEHKTSVLGRLDPRRLFGSAVNPPPSKEQDEEKNPATTTIQEIQEQEEEEQQQIFDERLDIIREALHNDPTIVLLTPLEVTRGRNSIRNSYRHLLNNRNTEDRAEQFIKGLQTRYSRQFQESLITSQYVFNVISEVARSNIPDNQLVNQVVNIIRAFITEKIQEQLSIDEPYWLNYLNLSGKGRTGGMMEEDSDSGSDSDSDSDMSVVSVVSDEPVINFNGNQVPLNMSSGNNFINSFLGWYLNTDEDRADRYMRVMNANVLIQDEIGNEFSLPQFLQEIQDSEFQGFINDFDEVRNIMTGDNQDEIDGLIMSLMDIVDETIQTGEEHLEHIPPVGMNVVSDEEEEGGAIIDTSSPTDPIYVVLYLLGVMIGVPLTDRTFRYLYNLYQNNRQVIDDVLTETDMSVSDNESVSSSSSEGDIEEGRGRKIIDFEDLKWGSFTKQFKAFKRQHPKRRIKDMEAFAKMILKTPKKFQERTLKRARFYLNVILKKGKN